MPTKIIEAVENIRAGMDPNTATKGFSQREKRAVIELYNQSI